MRVIDISEKPISINELLNSAIAENVILKAADGREFVLAEVETFDRELELTKQNEELMEFLEMRSEDKNTYTLQEVKQQLGL